jgi:hypothetical protein
MELATGASIAVLADRYDTGEYHKFRVAKEIVDGSTYAPPEQRRKHPAVKEKALSGSQHTLRLTRITNGFLTRNDGRAAAERRSADWVLCSGRGLYPPPA